MSACESSSKIMALVWTELSSSTHRIDFSLLICYISRIFREKSESMQFIRENTPQIHPDWKQYSSIQWLKWHLSSCSVIIYVIRQGIIGVLPILSSCSHWIIINDKEISKIVSSNVLQHSHPFFYKACQERAATIQYYSHHSAQSSTHQCTPL